MSRNRAGRFVLSTIAVVVLMAACATPTPQTVVQTVEVPVTVPPVEVEVEVLMDGLELVPDGLVQELDAGFAVHRHGIPRFVARHLSTA